MIYIKRCHSGTNCAKSDPPRAKRSKMFLPEAHNAVAIGIIGGADGPTAVYLEPRAESIRIACSALHFDVAENVKWRFMFREALRDDTQIGLIE